MSFKIVEKKTPTLRQYGNIVNYSRQRLKKFASESSAAISEGNMHAECHKFCEGWIYDHNLKACINENFEPYNRLLSIKDGELIATVDTDSIMDPNFRGTWGTELTQDSQIYDGDKYDNARTVVGTSPTRRFTSGSPMADKMTTPRSSEGKKKVLRFKI